MSCFYLSENIPPEDLLQVLVIMDLINPCKLWPSFCCETVQWIALEAWFRGSMQVQCVCCISAWSWLCEGGKKSICIFNFYGHCPNTPYRGCANSRYTPMMSDLYAHGWANFPVGANLLSWRMMSHQLCLCCLCLNTSETDTVCVGDPLPFCFWRKWTWCLPVCVTGPFLIDL